VARKEDDQLQQRVEKLETIFERLMGKLEQIESQITSKKKLEKRLKSKNSSFSEPSYD